MSYLSRYVILLDGAFVLKKLSQGLRRDSTAEDVVAFCKSIKCSDSLKDSKLLRIYYYDAEPSTDSVTNPIDGSILDMGKSRVHARHRQILDKLELKSDFALRIGETATHGWQVGQSAMKSMLRNSRSLEARDLVPNITQKGVDLRIGLDIARIALTKSAGTIVAVTGDSDLIPAFKFARREGTRVCLNTMGHGVKRSLKVHCDRILDVPLPTEKKRRSRRVS